MTNDTTTLNGSLMELGELMATNLTTMGVTANASDGLTTLANKILDIPVVETYNLTLTTNKNIISQAHSESATLTVTVTNNQGQAVADKTVTILKNEVYYTSTTTNSQGIATYTYNSQATGDIQFIANINGNISNSVSVEDCFYFNDGTINDIAINSGTIVTVENGALKITKSTSGEHKFHYPTLRRFTSSDNLEISIESAKENETAIQPITISYNPSLSASTQGYLSFWDSNNTWNMAISGDLNVQGTLSKGDIVKLVKQGTTHRLYHNNNLIATQTRTINESYIGGYTNQNRIQRLKNIKIKAIPAQ